MHAEVRGPSRRLLSRAAGLSAPSARVKVGRPCICDEALCCGWWGPALWGAPLLWERWSVAVKHGQTRTQARGEQRGGLAAPGARLLVGRSWRGEGLVRGQRGAGAGAPPAPGFQMPDGGRAWAGPAGVRRRSKADGLGQVGGAGRLGTEPRAASEKKGSRQNRGIPLVLEEASEARSICTRVIVVVGSGCANRGPTARSDAGQTLVKTRSTGVEARVARGRVVVGVRSVDGGLLAAEGLAARREGRRARDER
jgi:hypothetical protein